jgi:hypothetical protein
MSDETKNVVKWLRDFGEGSKSVAEKRQEIGRRRGLTFV